MTSWGNLQPLSTEFYSLLRYGLFLVLFLHLPFVGFIIGGSTVSLLLNFLGKEKRAPAHPRLPRHPQPRCEVADLRPFPIGIGAAVLLAVILAFFLFSNVYGILFNPEKLPLLRKQIGFLLSWNAVVKFLLFLAFFFGMTGGVILLRGGRSPGGEEGTDAGYRGFVRDVGAILTFSATLVLPVFVLFDLVTLPGIALSAAAC